MQHAVVFGLDLRGTSLTKLLDEIVVTQRLRTSRQPAKAPYRLHGRIDHAAHGVVMQQARGSGLAERGHDIALQYQVRRLNLLLKNPINNLERFRMAFSSVQK